MSDENIEPYDFTTLDSAVYDPVNPASFAEVIDNARQDVSALQEHAWVDVESQSTDDVDSYFKKYLIAQWRSYEAEHVEDVARRQGRGLPIHRAVILGILMRSDEVDEDFLGIASQYTREELLQQLSEASVSWLQKYNVKLDYNSEVEYEFSAWEVYIDPRID